MLGGPWLVIGALAGPAQLLGAQRLVMSSASEGDATTLRAPALGAGADALRRARWRAQDGVRGTDATPAAAPAWPAVPAASPAPAACASCDVDCESCRESDRQARYVIRRRATLLRTHRAFGIAAWGTMVATEVLGTMLAVARPTWFGDGTCAGGGGGFECGAAMTPIHETLAFLTTGLYTTAGILAIAAPDPDGASVGSDRAARTLRLHKTLAWVHGAGMVLLPLLGIVAAAPSIVGAQDSHTQDVVARTFRTVHTVVGYTTFAALSWSMYLELF